ncbi:GPI mannosyltransferase 2 [Bienertia sinuspersici]
MLKVCSSCFPPELAQIFPCFRGVGFLKYFQLKQLPNFLLASPVLSLAFCSIFSYLKADPKSFFSLGFGATLKKNSSAALFFSRGKEQVRDDHHYAAKQEIVNVRQRQKSMTQERSVSPTENQGRAKFGYYSVILLPFIYHLSFMAATTLFVMHVQPAFLLDYLLPDDFCWTKSDLGTLDLGICCFLHPPWHSAFLKLQSFHLNSSF